MNLCKKVIESAEELTTMLQDMTLQDKSIFNDLHTLQQVLQTTHLKSGWVFNCNESNITLTNYDNTLRNGMHPAKQLRINSDLIPNASYRNTNIPLPHVNNITGIHQILELLNYLEKLKPCQGVIGNQFEMEEVNNEYCEKESVEGSTIYRAKCCVQILKFGIRCENCERLYTRLRVSLSRKRKGGPKKPTNEELKVKIRKLQANLKYYKEKDKIKLIENDDKDMSNIFKEIDKEEELNLDNKMKKLWEAQRVCVRGKQNRWDPE